ncbi:MAG: shikimate dehydrogenase [Rikenellaceae bacterium]|jgi:shikimate dehydrogenase|nr:shikimate dehydrogenase [Rikenellaceae bacterium]
MKEYGLIGFPLGHSFSDGYFAEKFRAEGIEGCSYSKFPIETVDRLPQLLAEHPDLRGFNVTKPYKQQVMAFLDDLNDEARQIGAVNCVKIDNGRLTGYNTDAYGFRISLLELIGNRRPQALVLGSGGASKAVEYALKNLDMEHFTVSRQASRGRITYTDVDKRLLEAYPLIINATPLGTSPRTDEAPPLPYHFMTAENLLFDLVYNPPVTKFLTLGAARGARGINGYQMLVAQAEKSWEIWNGANDA